MARSSSIVGSWVWLSNIQSRRNGLISLLSVAETVSAIAFYWILSFFVDLYTFLVVSPIFAFMVLLRSPKSIRLGRTLFLSYSDADAPSDQFFVVICALGLFFSSGLIYICFNWGFEFISVDGVFTKIFLCLLVLPNAFLMTLILFAGALVKEGAIATQAKRALGIKSPDSNSSKPVSGGARAIGLLLLGPGIALGIFLRAVAIRFFSTTSYLLSGLSFFPRNWVRLVFCEDLRTPPVLVPDLPTDHQFSFDGFLEIRGRSIDEIAYTIVFGAVIFLPSWIYRISLKSTAWLYAPLLWVSYVPHRLRSQSGRLVWVGYAGRTLWDWFVLVSALGVILYAGVVAYDPTAYKEARLATEGQPFTPLHFLFAINPREFGLWYWITLPSAFITLALMIWLDKIRRFIQSGGEMRARSAEVRLILILDQVKNALTILWIIMSFISFVMTAWELGHLPEYFSGLVDVLKVVSSYWEYQPRRDSI